MKKIYNIGILAHVDAGKTTITENLLFKSKATKKLGNVNKGSAISDNLEVEKQRGISVRSATTSLKWKDAIINLIDTPGHIDFSSEVENVLQILDGAILVISAIEGVQAHTYNLWEILKNMNIPIIIFINKIDRQGADIFKIIAEIEKELKANIFILDYPINEGTENANILDLWQSDEIENEDLKNKSLENLAELDEKILELYLEEAKISKKIIQEKLSFFTKNKKISPVLIGVAKNGIGIENLLDAIISYIPNAYKDVNNENLSAIVFKIEHEKNSGRLAHIRLFSGQLKARDIVQNTTQNIEEKVLQIKKIYTNTKEILKELRAGDIAIISGMSKVKLGDILGENTNIKMPQTLNAPLLTVQVKAKNKAQYSDLAFALIELSQEDPKLDFLWLKEEQELHIKVMGKIQIEILEVILQNRFGIISEFSQATVIYKETPLKSGEGFVRYWMPKPCWAIMKFLIEPLPTGSGVVFESKVGINDIQQKYQNEVKRSIHKVLSQGIKAWEVTDLKITLIEGEDHEVHSRSGDFIIATAMGLMRALENTNTAFLEPILNFEIQSPEEFLGKITSQLINLRAVFENPIFIEDKFYLKGKIPVATSTDYAILLSSLTGGKAKVKFSFFAYQKCAKEFGKIRDYKGVNPLDESKWILHARGAYKRNEWKL